MSDLKRLLERSLREKEPDDFENIKEKVEEFIRDNKVDENAGKQLRAADPRIQKEVIHRGGLLQCKNPSSVCLARIREERKLLGDSLDVKQVTMARTAHESIRDGIVNQLDMTGAAAQVQAQQLQAQQRLIMAQQMALLQGGMGGIGSMNAIGGMGVMGGVANLGGMGTTLPGMPGIGGVAGGVAPVDVAGIGAMLGMGAIGSVGTLSGAVAGMGGMSPSSGALNGMLGMSIGTIGSTMPPQVMMHSTQPAAAPLQANLEALGQSVPSIGLTSPDTPSAAMLSSVMTSPVVASTVNMGSPGMTSPSHPAGSMVTPSPAVGAAVSGLGGISMASASSGSQMGRGQVSTYGLTVNKAVQRASPY